MFFGGDADAVAERGKDGLGERVGGFLAAGLDVDVDIVLGRRRKTVAHHGEGLDFAAFFCMSERFPCLAAECDGHA